MDDAHGAGPPLNAELAAGLAHEIRNELNSLHIHFGILDRELADIAPARPPQLASEMAGIARSLSAIDDLLTDFLCLARPQEVCYDSADVRALVRELIAFLAPEAQARGITLTADVSDAPAQALIDPAQMKRALLNLVLNGLAVTPNGGRVEVVCGSGPATWTLAVRDGGAGLPPHVRERLLSPFASGPGGAGLGLAIASQIVAAHGGTIDVQSAARRGTELRLTLPWKPSRHD